MRVLLFLFNPFLSSINSLVNFKEKHALTFLYFWFIIFGIGLVANNEAADSYRNVERFKNQVLTWQEYKFEVQDYFSFQTDTKDLYVLTVNFIVRQFTDNYHWEYLVFAIIFGFFYIRSLNYIVPHLSNSASSYILLFLFCFSNPIFNINGVRFWTAAWIGVYALFKIFIDKKYIYYLLLAITPFIHGSFYIWIVMVVIAQFVPQIRNIWIILYVLSIFISLGSQVSQLTTYSDLLPTFMNNYLMLYVDNDELIAFYEMKDVPLYARILNTLPSVILTVLTLLLAFQQKGIEHKKDAYYSLIDRYLVIATLVNFSSVVPTVGVRYIHLTMPILALIWAKFSINLKKYELILLFVPIAFSYSVFYWLKNISSVTEFSLYVFPAPLTILKYLF